MSSERPGGWVDGIGWVADEGTLHNHCIVSYYADETRVDQGVRADGPMRGICLVIRWEDGTVPARPSAPPTPEAEGWCRWVGSVCTAPGHSHGYQNRPAPPTPREGTACPNCGASFSLPLGMTCDDHRPSFRPGPVDSPVQPWAFGDEG